MRRLCRIAAWGLALYVAFVTLGPLSYRPETGYPETERFAGYFVLAAIFSIAYPNHRRWVMIGVVAASIALELGQFAAPGRDAGLPDVLAKAFGAIVGTVAISAGSLLLRSTRNGSPP